MQVPVRHTLATLAYRLGKAVRGAPPEFGDFAAGPELRSPTQILAHIGDVIAWALTQVQGEENWVEVSALAWPSEIVRCFANLEALDRYLAANGLGEMKAEHLFQGAIADALTHTGQIAYLRRMAGCPIRGENYSKAEIVSGRVGPEQSAAPREFD